MQAYDSVVIHSIMNPSYIEIERQSWHPHSGGACKTKLKNRDVKWVLKKIGEIFDFVNQLAKYQIWKKVIIWFELIFTN